MNATHSAQLYLSSLSDFVTPSFLLVQRKPHPHGWAYAEAALLPLGCADAGRCFARIGRPKPTPDRHWCAPLSHPCALMFSLIPYDTYVVAALLSGPIRLSLYMALLEMGTCNAYQSPIGCKLKGYSGLRAHHSQNQAGTLSH